MPTAQRLLLGSYAFSPGLYAWGSGTYGQRDAGVYADKSSPTQIGALTWSAITGGGGTYGNGLTCPFSLGITSDGKLYSWGRNQIGQLGDGTVLPRSAPTQVGSASWFEVKVAGEINTAGTASAVSFGIDSIGRLYGWGQNERGTLGQNDTISRSAPTQIGSSSWVAVACGVQTGTPTIKGNFMGAIRYGDNALFTCGENALGVLGLGDTVSRSQLTQVGTSSWSQISFGKVRGTGNYALGIDVNGGLYSWGSGSTGKLGLNDTVSRSTPTQVGTSSWAQVAAGPYSLAITSDGKLFEFGNGTSSPVQIGSSSWSQIANGYGGYAGIVLDGGLYVWGSNANGEIGNETTVASTSPVHIGSSSWTQVCTAGNYTLAIRSDGKLFAWGVNTWGNLGFSTDALAPTIIPNFTSALVCSSGTSHSMCINSLGQLFAFGGNSLGQLGDNTLVNRSNPVQVGFSSWVHVSGNGNSTLGILSGTKALYAWGYNFFGNLGDGTVTTRSSPVHIGTSSWTTVSAGKSHSVAITSTGLLYGWGEGISGQLGNGTAVATSSPVFVGGSSWAQVAAGASHSAGITSVGHLYAWGRNTEGQVGDGTVVSRSSPVLVDNSASWASVSCGDSFTAAIRTDGKLFTFGSNETFGPTAGGQLGDGTAINKSSPVQVGSNSWVQVRCGASYVIAVRSDKTLWTWGSNNDPGIFGLGTGNNVPRSNPVQIGSYVNWSSVLAAGENTVMGLAN